MSNTVFTRSPSVGPARHHAAPQFGQPRSDPTIRRHVSSERRDPATTSPSGRSLTTRSSAATIARSPPPGGRRPGRPPMSHAAPSRRLPATPLWAASIESGPTSRCARSARGCRASPHRRGAFPKSRRSIVAIVDLAILGRSPSVPGAVRGAPAPPRERGRSPARRRPPPRSSVVRAPTTVRGRSPPRVKRDIVAQPTHRQDVPGPTRTRSPSRQGRRSRREARSRLRATDALADCGGRVTGADGPAGGAARMARNAASAPSPRAGHAPAAAGCRVRNDQRGRPREARPGWRTWVIERRQIVGPAPSRSAARR